MAVKKTSLTIVLNPKKLHTKKQYKTHDALDAVEYARIACYFKTGAIKSLQCGIVQNYITARCEL
jgi:hypothetical protein